MVRKEKLTVFESSNVSLSALCPSPFFTLSSLVIPLWIMEQHEERVKKSHRDITLTKVKVNDTRGHNSLIVPSCMNQLPLV